MGAICLRINNLPVFGTAGRFNIGEIDVVSQDQSVTGTESFFVFKSLLVELVGIERSQWIENIQLG
jgi:hypothetical protein